MVNYTLTHKLLSSSLLGLPYRILNMSHKTELLRSLWVVRVFTVEGSGVRGLGHARSPRSEAFGQPLEHIC